MLERINAQIAGFVLEPSISKNVMGTIKDEFLRINVIQKPFETFAMFVFLELLSIFQTSHVRFGQIRSIHVKKSFIFVHPNFNGSGSVDSVSIFVIRKRVRMKTPKNVTHPRTG